MDDAVFARTLPCKVFVPKSTQIRLRRAEQAMLDQAARLQRQGLVSMRPLVEQSGAGGTFVDLALTALGRETFKPRGVR